MRLYQRGKTWWCMFYVDDERVQKSTRCRDRDAAEDAARRFEREAQAAELDPEPLGEIGTMHVLEELMEDIGQAERRRVLRWASDRWLGPNVEHNSGQVVHKSSQPQPKGGEPGAFKSRTETVELAREKGVICDRDVAGRYGITLSGARQRLYSAEQAGLLERVAPGRYAVPGTIVNANLKGVAAPSDLVAALVNLGYKKSDARTISGEAVRELGTDATLESLITHSLRRIGEAKAAPANGAK